jgi:hypothetical protein
LVKPKVRARAMSRLYWPAAEVELHALAGGVQRRVVELDLEAQLVAVIRLQPRPLQRRALALAHLHRLLHAQEALGRLLQLDARALQQEHEAGGRAVEDGHLLGGDVDIQVVQPQPGAGRQQVLDGLHLGRPGVAAGLMVVAMRVSHTAPA